MNIDKDNRKMWNNKMQGCMLIISNVNRELLRIPAYFGVIPEAGQMLLCAGACYSISSVTWLIEDNYLGCNIQVSSMLEKATK